MAEALAGDKALSARSQSQAVKPCWASVNVDAQALDLDASAHTRLPISLLDHYAAMNSLVSRFSTSGPEAELRKARAAAVEEGDFEDAAWGSEAGFGSLANGVPTFSVPSVPDVSDLLKRYRLKMSLTCISPPLFFVYTPTIMQTHHVASRSSTELPHLHSASREASS